MMIIIIIVIIIIIIIMVMIVMVAVAMVITIKIIIKFMICGLQLTIGLTEGTEVYYYQSIPSTLI